MSIINFKEMHDTWKSVCGINNFNQNISLVTLTFPFPVHHKCLSQIGNSLCLQQTWNQFIYNCYIYIYLFFLPCFQRVQGLVEDIITYCDFNHHTVSHVCTTYIQPTSLGQIFRKSIAFLQVELSLQAKDKNSLDLVEVSHDFQIENDNEDS